MNRIATELEPLRSETFPYPDQFADGISPLGPVCYFDAGTATDLPPVVLVHALGLNMTLWEHVAPPLASRTRVAGLDLPGCGRSAKPRCRYSLSLMAQAVVGLLDHLRIDRAVLVGHSYGGMVCTQVALEHPARAAGLVLMNSSGFHTFPRLFHIGARWLFRPYVLAPVLRLTVRGILRSVFATRNAHTDHFLRTVLERQDPRFLWDFAYYVSPMVKDLMSNVLPRIEELTLPTLVIWGTKDRLLPFRDVLPWVGRMRNVRLVALPDCGHMPNLEKPEAVSAAVLEFLEQVGQQARSA
ncbi:MAG: alpha/beta fold hydrolase [Myxococcota bacterium]|nr:alpha/beta fold hydrolase [Myxococcota bacterium]